ncbi:MAG: 30S ribosomal protein S16 [Candidatus Parcubacteria bacterium]|nr:30S ribosomal protein S16 [Candidatus Parcubacteria bacterium]
MLSIRFLRRGKLHQPSYKIVVTEKTRPPKSGKFIEQLGSYDPKTKEKIFNSERIKYWISKGAQPSDTIHNLLVKNKIITGVKLAVHSVKKGKGEEPAVVQQPSVEAPKAEVTKEEAPKEEIKPEAPEQPKQELGSDEPKESEKEQV